MSLFDSLFGPQTPEERKALALAGLRDRAAQEKLVAAALPLVREMRKQAHELVKMGIDLTTVRRELALTADNMTAFLEQPPPLDPPT